MTPSLRLCGRAERRLRYLVEKFQPEIGFLLETAPDQEPVVVAAHPSLEQAWSGRSSEALEHLLLGGEPRLFAAPRPGSPALAALLGGALDVVLVGKLPDCGLHFYLSRPLEKGLYSEADLVLAQRPPE